MRSQVIFLPLLLLLLAPPGLYAAEEDCTLSSDALVPQLNAKDPRVKLSIAPKRTQEGKRLAESLTLKDGLKITYDVGGCAHYSYSFTYENVKGLETASAKKFLQQAASLLQNNTPLIQAFPQSNAYRLFEALQKASSGDDRVQSSIPLPCGDAQCALEAKAPSTVILSYDFAL